MVTENISRREMVVTRRCSVTGGRKDARSVNRLQSRTQMIMEKRRDPDHYPAEKWFTFDLKPQVKPVRLPLCMCSACRSDLF